VKNITEKFIYIVVISTTIFSTINLKSVAEISTLLAKRLGVGFRYRSTQPTNSHDYQLSTINYQLSTINYQLSTINYQLSTAKAAKMRS